MSEKEEEAKEKKVTGKICRTVDEKEECISYEATWVGDRIRELTFSFPEAQKVVISVPVEVEKEKEEKPETQTE